MVKKVVGICRLEDISKLSELSDEFYFGLNYIENHRKWYPERNFNSKKEALEAILAAVKAGKKINLAANENYDEREIDEIVSQLSIFTKKGLSGIILKDVNLASRIKAEKISIKMILSSTALCFNSYCADFFSSLGCSRIILPQQMSPCEASSIIKRHPKMEFECFYLPDSYCSNIDGLCLYHEAGGGEFRSCSVPYLFKGKKMLMGKPLRHKRFLSMAAYFLLGVSHVKIPRDGTLQEKIKSLKTVFRLERSFKSLKKI